MLFTAFASRRRLRQQKNLVNRRISLVKRFGKYLLHECVAQGGITEIWMAADEFENVVAVRKLRGRGLSASGPKLFKAGLKVHQKLSPHPNIIRFIDHGKTNGTPFMVLQYIEGADLKAALTRRHDIIDNVSDVLVQMADGLNHLHDRGWIHLDYKPENIMISLNGHVSLIDFDTAQKMPRKPKKYPKISGTPSYMPPEQLKGESVDQRADIYAWGSTAYELLTHLRPFGGRTPEESRRNQLDAKFRVKPVHQHNPQVPVALSQLIGNCLAHQPDARYPNMTVLNARLHSILGVQHQPVAEHSLALAS